MARPHIDTKTLMEGMRSTFPTPPIFTDLLKEREWLKFRLAQALRIFGNRGYDEGIAGHITVRDPIDPDSFWVNPFGLHFKIIQPKDLLLVNSAGVIQPESGLKRPLNVAAFMIHVAVHAARPDIICAAHSHSKYCKAFASLGKELDMISQDACAFYKDLAVYNDHHGIAFQSSEGEAIAKALGSKKVLYIFGFPADLASLNGLQAALLKNHGALVVSDSVEATLHFYIQLEKACEVQLIADCAAAARGEVTEKISDDNAAATGKTLGETRNLGWFAGLMEFEYLELTEGVAFDLGTSV